MGHGFHKDVVLFDVLAAISAAPSTSKTLCLEHLRSISPVIQVIDEITDGDETNYLKCELAAVVREVIHEALPPYLRALQRDGRHWPVESCFTDLVKSAPLDTVYERALATTLVHEEALTALQERAAVGDAQAGSVLASILAYCGRHAVTPKEPDSRSGIRTGG